jgi:hypothetical protein
MPRAGLGASMGNSWTRWVGWGLRIMDGTGISRLFPYFKPWLQS